MKIYKGKTFFKIEGCPWYGTGVEKSLQNQGYVENICLKAWKIPFFSNLYLAKRMYIKDLSEELKNRIKEAAKRYFNTDNVDVAFNSIRSYTIRNKDTDKSIKYFEETFNFFKYVEDITFTDNPLVLFSEKEQKYYAYSHRGHASFGIGDMLFVEKLTNDDAMIFYRDSKYRKKFIESLKKYDKENDEWSFYDLVRGGILDVVPFKEKGKVHIETLQDAYKAACNFARYVS